MRAFAIATLVFGILGAARANGVTSFEESGINDATKAFLEVAFVGAKKLSAPILFPIGYADGFELKYRLYPKGNYQWIAAASAHNREPGAGQKQQVMITGVHQEGGAGSATFGVYLQPKGGSGTPSREVGRGTALLVKGAGGHWRVVAFTYGQPPPQSAAFRS